MSTTDFQMRTATVTDKATSHRHRFLAYCRQGEVTGLARLTYPERKWDVQDDEEVVEHGHHAEPIPTPSTAQPRKPERPTPRCRWCQDRPTGCLYCKGLNDLAMPRRTPDSRIYCQRQPALASANCSHDRREEIGQTCEGMGTILLYWCPDCGALKRTMTNWRYTDYPWKKPRHANEKVQP